jgi:clan AA aspartic protease (TIGR02281 family)
LEAGARIDFGQTQGRIRSGGARSPSSAFAANRTPAAFLQRVRTSAATRSSARWIALAVAALVAILAIAVTFGRDHPPAASPDAAEEIKLESSGNTYQLKVTVNDTVKLNFTLDTGASDVLIPAEVALTLLTSGTLSESDFIGYQTYKLADGSTLPSAQFKLRDIEVGNRQITDVVASVGPVGSSPLLGQSFLSRLGTWTIDNRQQVLRIAR